MCARLFAGVDDVSANNLASLHEVKDLAELGQADGLEGDLDEAATEEVESLSRVGSVTDVAALDLDHAHNSVEDGSTEVGIGGETDADDDTLGADVLGGLLEGLLGDGDEEDGVGAAAVGGGGLDLLDEVGRGGEVDVGVGTEGLAEVALLGAAVDGDGVDAHGLGVLEGDGTETATGADDGEGLAGADARLLDALVDGDTGAEHGGDGLEVDTLGDAGDVGGLGDGVLLEGSVNGVAREEGLFAEGLVRVLAVCAAQA